MSMVNTYLQYDTFFTQYNTYCISCNTNNHGNDHFNLIGVPLFYFIFFSFKLIRSFLVDNDNPIINVGTILILCQAQNMQC